MESSRNIIEIPYPDLRQLDNLPPQMKRLSNFINCRLAPKPDGKGWEKKPYGLQKGESWQDSLHWWPLSMARQVAESRNVGVAFMLSEGCGLFCLDEDGVLPPHEVKAIIERFNGKVWVERSVSGRLHIWGAARGAKYKSTSAKLRAGLQIFTDNGGHYVMLTGKTVQAPRNGQLEDCTDELQALIDEYAVKDRSEAVGWDDDEDETEDDQAVVRKVRQSYSPGNRRPWADLYDGKIPDIKEPAAWCDRHGDLMHSGSEVDSALMGHICKFTKNNEQALRIFLESGWAAQRPPQKMAREKYLHDTLLLVRKGDKAREVSDDTKKKEEDLYPILQWAEAANVKPVEWIVDELLPRGGLGMIYGDSEAGKSVIALDLAAAIAQGVQWRGLRVRQGRVIYLAAEHARGVGNRMKAYEIQNNIEPGKMDFYVVPVAPNLLVMEDTSRLIRTILSIGQASVIVIDTKAQVTPDSDENASKDMGPLLRNCQALAAETGSLVLLIHHIGKDASRGARGWSGLRGAMDVQLYVERTATGSVLSVTKLKDADKTNKAWAFGFQDVPIGVDDEGVERSSFVVTEAPLMPRTDKGRQLGALEAIAESVLHEFAAEQSAGIEFEAVVAEIARRLTEPTLPGQKDQRKKRARKALRSLLTTGGRPYEYDETTDCIEIFDCDDYL